MVPNDSILLKLIAFRPYSVLSVHELPLYMVLITVPIMIRRDTDAIITS
jgi:hypothetical protein